MDDIAFLEGAVKRLEGLTAEVASANKEAREEVQLLLEEAGDPSVIGAFEKLRRKTNSITSTFADATVDAARLQIREQAKRSAELLETMRRASQVEAENTRALIKAEAEAMLNKQLQQLYGDGTDMEKVMLELRAQAQSLNDQLKAACEEKLSMREELDYVRAEAEASAAREQVGNQREAALRAELRVCEGARDKATDALGTAKSELNSAQVQLNSKRSAGEAIMNQMRIEHTNAQIAADETIDALRMELELANNAKKDAAAEARLNAMFRSHAEAELLQAREEADGAASKAQEMVHDVMSRLKLAEAEAAKADKLQAELGALADSAAQIAALKQQLEDQETANRSLLVELHESKLSVSKLEQIQAQAGDVDGLRNELSETSSELERMRAELASYKVQLNADSYKELRRQLMEASSELDKFRRASAARGTKLDPTYQLDLARAEAARLQAEMDACRKMARETMAKVDQARGQKDAIERTLTSLVVKYRDALTAVGNTSRVLEQAVAAMERIGHLSSSEGKLASPPLGVVGRPTTAYVGHRRAESDAVISSLKQLQLHLRYTFQGETAYAPWSELAPVEVKSFSRPPSRSGSVPVLRAANCGHGPGHGASASKPVYGGASKPVYGGATELPGGGRSTPPPGLKWQSSQTPDVESTHGYRTPHRPDPMRALRGK